MDLVLSTTRIFTSPIRRYPDLIVHRLLFEYEALRKKRKKISTQRLAELTDKIRTVCQISNEREKSAVEAERESIKLKQVEYICLLYTSPSPRD